MSRALSAVVVLLLTTTVFAKDVTWPPGHVYTSRTKLFTLKVRDGGTFQVQEGAKKGDNAYEEVKLMKRDGGLYSEAYMVGVRRLGRDVRSIVEQPQGALIPPTSRAPPCGTANTCFTPPLKPTPSASPARTATRPLTGTCSGKLLSPARSANC